MIDFAKRFKARAQENLDDARRLLDSPWELREFADDASTAVAVREKRHILLHLLHPESFERSPAAHKRDIDAAFRVLLDGQPPDDLDERLLAIRRRLEDRLPEGNTSTGDIDFYFPPLRGIWYAEAGGEGEGAGDLEALEWKKQIILYGPPGTSKSFRPRILPTR